MDLNRLLNNDPELRTMVNDLAEGRITDKYRDVPFGSHQGMREAYDEVEKFSRMFHGED